MYFNEQNKKHEYIMLSNISKTKTDGKTMTPILWQENVPIKTVHVAAERYPEYTVAPHEIYWKQTQVENS